MLAWLVATGVKQVIATELLVVPGPSETEADAEDLASRRFGRLPEEEPAADQLREWRVFITGLVDRLGSRSSVSVNVLRRGRYRTLEFSIR